MYLSVSKLLFEVLRPAYLNWYRLVVSLTSLGPISGVHLRVLGHPCQNHGLNVFMDH